MNPALKIAGACSNCAPLSNYGQKDKHHIWHLPFQHPVDNVEPVLS